MTDEQPPAGEWKADPTGRHQRRWWDGTAWTDHVSDGGANATDPYQAASPPTPPVAPPMAPVTSPPEHWTPPAPVSPREDAAASKRSRAPWVIGIVLALVAAGVAVVLLGGDDGDGASGAGDVAGEITGSDGGIVTHEVSLPAGSAMVIRVQPTDEDFDIVANVLCDDSLVGETADLGSGLTDIGSSLSIDSAVVDALGEYIRVDGAPDSSDLEDDGVDPDQIDGLPSSHLLRVDVGYSGEEEVLIVLAPVDSDLTVAFAGYDGDEGAFEGRIDIVDLGVDGTDPDDWADAIADSDELAELVR